MYRCLKSVYRTLLIIVLFFTPIPGACAATCTENDWTYSDGPCASNFTTTRTWTKITPCAGGVTHPPTETVSCIYRGSASNCQPLNTYTKRTLKFPP